MKIQKKQDFLITIAYWAVIAAAVYLSVKYILPITVPIIVGVLASWLVVWISRKVRCTHRLMRISLAILLYGVIGTLIGLLATKAVGAVSAALQLLPKTYESRILPFANLCYEAIMEWVQLLDPSLVSTLETMISNLLSALTGLVSTLSSFAVNLVSKVATGIPSLILSLLAMIFTTIFVVSDYEQIAGFTASHIPQAIKNILNEIKFYLTNTLLVVIRSYALIMLLTFTELSILFSVFGIGNPLLKAGIIAVLDILPILGTGGIMIPWAVISFALGNTPMGIKLLVIYVIVTVIRNYVEPKIVGAQLGLHPIITLVSMFIGLRLFGFWGLFGLPVGISFLWKRRQEAQQKQEGEPADPVQP